MHGAAAVYMRGGGHVCAGRRPCLCGSAAMYVRGGGRSCMLLNKLRLHGVKHGVTCAPSSWFRCVDAVRW